MRESGQSLDTTDTVKLKEPKNIGLLRQMAS